MSPFGDRRYGIKYLRRLRFFISGPNELTEPKFNTHTLKDLYNLIKKFFFKNFVFFCQDRVSKNGIFSFFLNVFFGGVPIKNNERERVQKMFLKLL